MAFLLSILAVLTLLLISEWWWRRNKKHGEISRKFVHITVGGFVAFWPYLLSPLSIKLISIAFILVVILSKYFNIFQAIHSVQRPTNGELWFALALGFMAFWVHDNHIFTTSLLIMALADGLAAIVGVSYGKGNTYKIAGLHKSLAGSATFFLVAYIILLMYWTIDGQGHSMLYILPIALVSTLIENLGYKGLDNFLVPVYVATALTLIS